MSTSTSQEPDHEEEVVEHAEQEVQYGCPFCDETYDNELVTRVHVTRSEDNAHINRDGLMPETEIEVVNEAGKIVETISRRPNDINLETLQAEDLQDNLSGEHKQILLTAAYNPFLTTYTELEEKVSNALKQRGYSEDDIPSYSTVRRVIREFYRPQEVEAEKQNRNKENDEEILGDLTPRQQAIVIAHLANPDESTSQIARRAGNTSNSYPGQVYNRAEAIIDRLQRSIDDGETVGAAILAEMTAEDVSNLYAESERLLHDDVDHADSEGFNLGVDLAGALDDSEKDAEEFDLPVNEQRQVMSASPYDSPEPDSLTDTVSADAAAEAQVSGVDADGTVETWGSADSTDEITQDAPEPETEAEVEAEQPKLTEKPEAEPEVEGESETKHEATQKTVVSEPGPASAEAVKGGEYMVPASEIEALREHISWAREVAEAESTKSLAEKVEKELGEILAK
jgi:hypothetical protein